MYAVEFDTKIENGFIKIPKEYSELCDIAKAKLIIMYDEKIAKDTTSSSQIDFSKYKVPSLKDIEDPVKWQQDVREEWN